MVQAILHNIRSVHNVGSIFRTADGLGVDKLYLTGYTPKPIDRFGRKRQRFSKVALGAEKALEWEKKESVINLITNIQDSGGHVIACEPTDEAVDINDFSAATDDMCLVFGNEVDGLEGNVIAESDHVVKITMKGKKSSLNVAVSFGILIHSIVDKYY
jgi:tRNA G18 (ribose-2'-O)-methylase SpoU